jgi:amino acid transporter
VAVNVQAIGGIVLAVVLGFATGGPLNAFALLGTVATIIIVSIYILINLSNIAFYWREQRGEFNAFFNLVVPVVGTLVFLPALLAAFGIDFAGLGISPLTPPANAAPWIIGAWMLIGIAALVYFRQRAPERMTQVGAVFLQG